MARLLRKVKALAVAALARGGLRVDRSFRGQVRICANELGPFDLVVDVGVAQGTPELYAAAPDGFLLLIEPLEVYEEDIQRILDQRPGLWLRKGAGSQRRSATFVVAPDPRKSGEAPRQSSDLSSSTTVDVEIATVDELVASAPISRPIDRILLKLDCEGAELDALRGAEEVLGRTTMLVVEVGLLGGSPGSDPSDLIRFVADRGLELYDVAAVGRRRGVAQHADLVFARKVR